MNSSHLNNATLIFDLDGTLVDTAPDLIGTLNHILHQGGIASVPETMVRPYISLGARRMIVEGLKLAGEPRTESEIDAMLTRFLDHYGANVAVNSAPYPNVLAALDAASRQGARLGVCTNKREALSRSLLAALGMHDRFAAIVGRDTLDVYKPDPRHLTETIARAGGDVTRAVMIGDSPTDVNTAKAAGVPVVAVSFGYSEVPVHDLGADAVIDDYAELLDALPALVGR